MIGARLRAMTAGHWLALYGGLAPAWSVLVAMAVGPGTTIWTALCAPGAEAGLAGLWAMWALMVAAMMLPTALPALAVLDDLSRGDAAAFAGFAGVLAAVWAGFAALAALVQAGLTRAGLLGAAGESLSVALSAALLVAAGLYQFSALKAACLSRCRAPLALT